MPARSTSSTAPRRAPAGGNQLWHQDIPGIEDIAGAYDRFGGGLLSEAITTGSRDLFVVFDGANIPRADWVHGAATGTPRPTPSTRIATGSSSSHTPRAGSTARRLLPASSTCCGRICTLRDHRAAARRAGGRGRRGNDAILGGPA